MHHAPAHVPHVTQCHVTNVFVYCSYSIPVGRDKIGVRFLFVTQYYAYYMQLNKHHLVTIQ